MRGRRFWMKLKFLSGDVILDYAVLDDMKLMLQREPKTPELYGYNVKKGAGGIRAIEFAVHVQQLIAGGREQSLRASSTITALNALAQQHWISTESAEVLTPPLLYFAGVGTPHPNAP